MPPLLLVIHAAPEVVDGLPHDKSVDWWGLGILLWEFLTGAQQTCRGRLRWQVAACT